MGGLGWKYYSFFFVMKSSNDLYNLDECGAGCRFEVVLILLYIP